MNSSGAQIWTSLAEKSSSLKTLKIKKTFHSYEFEANKAYLGSFQYLKTLENLNIDVSFYLPEQNNQILTTIFFTHLASFTDPKSLNLTFVHNHPGSLSLFLSLRSLLKLEQLYLNLMYCCNKNNQFFQDLALTITCFCNLELFELILPRLDDAYEAIIALSSNFSQLSQLKNVSLNFQNINVNHKIMEILYNSLAHLFLSSLKIILDSQPQKPKSFFQKLSAFWGYEQRLTSLFSALYGFSSLENLSLNLSGFDICTKEFKHFSLALKELKQLRSLSLELPQFDPGNNFEGLRKFLSGLKELQKLECLHLAFKGTKLCTKEVELVARNLQDCSRYLEDLALYFEHSEKLRNEVFSSISWGLQNFLSLKSLTLVIEKQKVFQKEGVIDLLKKLTILKGWKASV